MTAIPQSISQTMRGVELVGHGGFEMLRYRDNLPVPTPQRGDVLIRVLAAGVNNTDLNLRTGWYAKDQAEKDGGWRDDTVDFPLIQGADVCGTVVAVGEGVPERRIGQRVIVEPTFWEWHGQTLEQPLYLGSDCPGGFAEYVVVPARHAFTVTTDASDVELAAIPCSSSAARLSIGRCFPPWCAALKPASFVRPLLACTPCKTSPQLNKPLLPSSMLVSWC
jgi:NADPH:quinone reductase-like Zn-dependent oxidoreductase